MTRVFNFGAGPATLPDSILREAQAELLDWQGSGVSVMEIGHRTTLFQQLMEDAEASLRELLLIPDHYHVLFLGGAARTQFAMIPLNLLDASGQAGYVVSGVWSSMAFDEATKLKSAYCLASSAASGFTELPEYDAQALREDTRYVYYTANETVNGTQFAVTPLHQSIPLVADMTSCLLTEPINLSDYGLIFAGAQKNIAPAGLTLVIVRHDLLENTPSAVIPTMLDFRIHSQQHSLYATPPTFNCYMANKMFHWVKAQGGLAALSAINRQKSDKLYQYLDQSSAYDAFVTRAARSIVNVCFRLKRPELETLFFQQAERRGLFGLQGHRLVGGVRASLYNAMPMAGVDALLEHLHDFSKQHF